jgi:redox-sensitive bicupin YhaK (pirin superfamily)
VTAAEDTNVRYVLVAGEPINEPIYQYGPFVMGNEEGILQSISDFRNFSNGFERGRGWESELAKRYNI